MSYTSTRSAKSDKRLTPSMRLARIASLQRRGDVTKVANLTGYSVSYVSEVLNYKYENNEIINTAYGVMRKRKRN